METALTINPVAPTAKIFTARNIIAATIGTVAVGVGGYIIRRAIKTYRASKASQARRHTAKAKRVSNGVKVARASKASQARRHTAKAKRVSNGVKVARASKAA